MIVTLHHRAEEPAQIAGAEVLVVLERFTDKPDFARIVIPYLKGVSDLVVDDRLLRGSIQRSARGPRPRRSWPLLNTARWCGWRHAFGGTGVCTGQTFGAFPARFARMVENNGSAAGISMRPAGVEQAQSGEESPRDAACGDVESVRAP